MSIFYKNLHSVGDVLNYIDMIYWRYNTRGGCVSQKDILLINKEYEKWVNMCGLSYVRNINSIYDYLLENNPQTKIDKILLDE